MVVILDENFCKICGGYREVMDYIGPDLTLVPCENCSGWYLGGEALNHEIMTLELAQKIVYGKCHTKDK